MFSLLLLTWLGTSHAVVPVAPPAAAEITMWLLTADPGDEVASGAAMGADEMTRTASLLKRQFVLHKMPVVDVKAAIRKLTAGRRAHGTLFLLLDLEDEAACDVARHVADARTTVVMNARVLSHPCAAPMLFLRLPQAQRESLMKRLSGEAGRLDVDEWHSSLQRYGAQELNERYQRAHGTMTGDAWAGWFATKVAAESALRLRNVSRQVLTGPEAPSFDGHKGVPLRFDASGALAQPVYVIDRSGGGAGKVLKEVS